MTGMDLKVLRIRNRVKQGELAEAAGWSSRVRVAQIESQERVSAVVEARYTAGLRKLVGEGAARA